MRKRTSPTSILVGDIGGTRTRLALYDAPGRKLLLEAVLPSSEYQNFDDIALAFLARSHAPHPRVALLGIAGPVKNRTAAVTNLPWRLEERALSRRLEIRKVVLQNDLVVAARGCLHLPADALEVLTEHKRNMKGNHLGVIAAGTGLGEARLIWTGSRHIVLATEGGHTDFAPRSPLEIELWHFLAARYPDHVSYERIL